MLAMLAMLVKLAMLRMTAMRGCGTDWRPCSTMRGAVRKDENREIKGTLKEMNVAGCKGETESTRMQVVVIAVWKRAEQGKTVIHSEGRQTQARVPDKETARQRLASLIRRDYETARPNRESTGRGLAGTSCRVSTHYSVLGVVYFVWIRMKQGRWVSIELAVHERKESVKRRKKGKEPCAVWPVQRTSYTVRWNNLISVLNLLCRCFGVFVAGRAVLRCRSLLPVSISLKTVRTHVLCQCRLSSASREKSGDEAILGD